MNDTTIATKEVVVDGILYTVKADAYVTMRRETKCSIDVNGLTVETLRFLPNRWADKNGTKSYYQQKKEWKADVATIVENKAEQFVANYGAALARELEDLESEEISLNEELELLQERIRQNKERLVAAKALVAARKK